jgi:hypothetical protein
MAKRNKVSTEDKEQEPNFLSKMIGAKTSGSYFAETGESRVVGIEFPSLALMWVSDSNVLPLSKMVGFAGFPASHKSGMGFEIARWFADIGGFSRLVDTEGEKISHSMVKAMLRGHYENKKMLIDPATDAQQVMSILTDCIRYTHKIKATDTPLCMIIDSLTGVDAATQVEKVMKDGFADKAFAIAALGWDKYFKVFIPLLVGYPQTLVVINHLKEKPSAMPGRPAVKHTPGGVAQKFFASLYYYLANVGKKERAQFYINGEVRKLDHEIHSVQFHCQKSSWGVSDRKFNFDFISYKDPETDTSGALWDWDESTARFLDLAQNSSDYLGENMRNQLKDICAVRSVGSDFYDCKRLGVSGTHGRDLGRMIREDRNLFVDLQKALGIIRHKIYDGEMPACSKHNVDLNILENASKVESLPEDAEL